MDHRVVTTRQAQVSESNFISRVYLWMSLGLIFSAMASGWLVMQPALLRLVFTNNLLLIGLVVAETVELKPENP